MNSEKKFHPGSRIRGVKHTVVQMALSGEIFHSIYVHVALVSVL